MKFLFILLVKIYQYTISPLIGNSCRFYPSCSEYCILALRKHGALKGGWLSMKRIAKCGPWNKGGVDNP
ncbi:MAG TPA: membrane protein insertion efficiency factor YidD [Rhabdochlamydiaceae bacterium]|nr:membrane protein insertion efficiency factor YidD [Rhabdochlamydiaceae bacterium]